MLVGGQKNAKTGGRVAVCIEMANYNRMLEMPDQSIEQRLYGGAHHASCKQFLSTHRSVLNNLEQSSLCNS